MNNFERLEQIYQVNEISEHCVDINFAYAFVCAMACCELELEQWMPSLFLNGISDFSNATLATEFANAILAIYEQSERDYSNTAELNIDAIVLADERRVHAYANGYLQAMILFDNLEINTFCEGSPEANLQHTCLLLLDKLTFNEEVDEQKKAVFAQLPEYSEIIALLPTLLGRYGQQCKLAKAQ
ncbi:UPF0149 family protein [Psychromonas sp. psych-6C06]|uniref:UPF0149 family protein n=1 Tax=Psychromonas sp. psych-6C06 TaxID=2058089 RepID=UPI00187CED6E|nr:UPF0149 family protein [Psychromonas sp. psych-6C06]